MSPSTAVSAANQPVPSDEQLEILSVFSEIPDTRHSLGKRHHIALCLALFTLSIAAGNQGFMAIGDWLKSYEAELLKLYTPPKRRLPSYSTIRRVLLNLDYKAYSAALARFFDVEPLPGETLAMDGKQLRGSYQIETNNPESPPHPAILLVSAYIVERGLILEPHQVDSKTNEIKALPEFIEQLALKGIVIAFDAISTQKNMPADC